MLGNIYSVIGDVTKPVFKIKNDFAIILLCIGATGIFIFMFFFNLKILNYFFWVVCDNHIIKKYL